MDWFNDFVKAKPVMSLMIPSVISIFNFISNMIVYITNGQLESPQLHQLLGSANGIETVILLVVMVALNKKKV